MNPVVKLALALVLGLEISEIADLRLNLVLIVFSLIYLGLKRATLKQFLALGLVPLIPATGLLLSQVMYGAGWQFGLVIFTRIYAYLAIGIDLKISETAIRMASALEQDCRVPTKFVFGVLGAMNLIPEIKTQLKIIKAAARMREIRLGWFSPVLYFKAILAAIRWANWLSMAMISHGFVVDHRRTHYHRFRIKTGDWVGATGILVIIQFLTWL